MRYLNVYGSYDVLVSMYAYANGLGRGEADERVGGSDGEAGGVEGVLRVAGLRLARHFSAGEDQGGPAADKGGDPLLRHAHRGGVALAAGCQGG